MKDVYSDYLAIMNDTYGNDEFTFDGYQFANLRTILEDILNEPRLENLLVDTSYGEFSERLDGLDMEEHAERVSAFSLSYSGQLFPQRSETRDDVKMDAGKSLNQDKNQAKFMLRNRPPIYAGLPPFGPLGPFGDMAGLPIDDGPLPEAE